jgi:hypothetical protein
MQPTTDTPTAGRPPKPGRTGYAPSAGMAWSPLRDWPRNEACWCGPGVKAKKCHLPVLPSTMTAKDAKPIREAMAAPEAPRCC